MRDGKIEEMRVGRVRHFSDLLVWQKSHQLFLSLAKDVRSIPSNSTSAEGFNAPTTKEYLRYLDTARRSTHESENWFLKLRDLQLLNGHIQDRLDACTEIARMLICSSSQLAP